MNITDALIEHHGELRRLYQASLNDPAQFELFIKHLIVHHTMEEKYFYDLMEQAPDARHDALEAVNEHHIIELIIKDAEGFPADHQNFPIKIEGLGEYTSHHLDEEEMEIFPMASQFFTVEDADALGKLFLEAKKKLLGVEPPEVPPSIQPGNSGNVSSAARGLGIGSLKF